MQNCSFCGKSQDSLSLCSRCRKVSYCSPECQKSDWKQHKPTCSETLQKPDLPTVKPLSLSEPEHRRLMKILKAHFINVYRIIYLISQPEADSFKSRNAFFHSKKHPEPQESTQCCQAFFSKIYIPEGERTPLERAIAAMLSPAEFQRLSFQFLEQIARTFFKIKEGGIRDKLPWDRNHEQYLLHEVLKEGVQNEFLKELKRRMLREQKTDSKEPGLYATPAVWERENPGIPLDLLRPETVSGLVNGGFAFQSEFIGNRDLLRDLYKELQLLALDGRFEELINEEQRRKDRCLWVNLREIERKSLGTLYRLCVLLTALPYELNKKNAGFFAQISEIFQISLFNEGAFQNKMMDSMMEDDRDNGRTISCFYFCNIEADFKRKPGKVRVFGPANEETEFLMDWDSILLFKSRKISYEIEKNEGGKQFVVRFWVTGPRDFKDQRF